MEKTISAAKANHKFSKLLKGVKEGDSYIVTSHGKPVAKIEPISEQSRFAAKARPVLHARLRTQPVLEIGRWTRDDLYAR
jgi:prevent-host-death family protein